MAKHAKVITTCPHSLFHILFVLFLLQFCHHIIVDAQQQEEKAETAEDFSSSATFPLLLSLCTSLIAPSSSSRLGQSSAPFVSRSLALLSRPDQIAQLGLFAGNESAANGAEEEWAGTSKWMDPPDGQIRCSLRLEACPECLIRLQWDTPRTHFTDFQMHSLANCENGDSGKGGDLLARGEQSGPCFGLQLVEERADRPLPPNAESASPNSLANPAFVFRRASIWEVAEGEAQGQFQSTGNSLLLVATLRHIRHDPQLGRWLRRVFPLKITVLDNKVVAMAQWNNSSSFPSPSSLAHGIPSMEGGGAVGVVQSARFPAAYPRAMRQNVTIVRPPGGGGDDGTTEIRLWFDDFHLHYISELKILDWDGRELFNSRREHRRPPPIATKTRAISLLFAAREFTEPVGFRAQFRLAGPGQPWPNRPSPKNCDDHLEGFGGRLSLDGQRHLLGEWVDCVWLVGRLTTGSPPAQQFDHIYIRVDQFHARGQQLELEVREGGNSQGRLLLQLDGEQSPKQLVQKQPAEGFTLAQGPDGNPPAFYVRFRGRLESLSGLSILYAYFYRWPTALCPGGPDEFHCDNGKCIRASLRCDGFDHCGDSSDELCHFTPERGAADGDDLSTWPSSVLTIAFGLLTLFLLLLLLVLFASRTARRHLVPSPLGQLYSLQSVRRRFRQQQQQQQQPRRQCCRTSQQQQAGQQRNGAGGGGANQRQTHRQPNGQQQQAGADRRNSSSLATQLDFAVLNNLLGSAAANLGPSIQTLGERRFFVLPADQAPISVIEAPPTYQDALKHPKVTPRGSRRLVHPSEAPIVPRRNSPAVDGNGVAYQNMAFRLSPGELLRMEMERERREEGRRSNDDEEDGDEMGREAEEGEEEEEGDGAAHVDEGESPHSPGLLSRSTSPAQSPRTPPRGFHGRFETVDLDGEEEPESGPCTSSHSITPTRLSRVHLDGLAESEEFGGAANGPTSSPSSSSCQEPISECQNSQAPSRPSPASSSPHFGHSSSFPSNCHWENATKMEGADDSPPNQCQSARMAQRREMPLSMRPASARRSTVAGEFGLERGQGSQTP